MRGGDTAHEGLHSNAGCSVGFLYTVSGPSCVWRIPIRRTMMPVCPLPLRIWPWPLYPRTLAASMQQVPIYEYNVLSANLSLPRR